MEVLQIDPRDIDALAGGGGAVSQADQPDDLAETLHRLIDSLALAGGASRRSARPGRSLASSTPTGSCGLRTRSRRGRRSSRSTRRTSVRSTPSKRCSIKRAVGRRGQRHREARQAARKGQPEDRRAAQDRSHLGGEGLGSRGWCRCLRARPGDRQDQPRGFGAAREHLPRTANWSPAGRPVCWRGSSSRKTRRRSASSSCSRSPGSTKTT
jgi:hypothetical protein